MDNMDALLWKNVFLPRDVPAIDSMDADETFYLRNFLSFLQDEPWKYSREDNWDDTVPVEEEMYVLLTDDVVEKLKDTIKDWLICSIDKRPSPEKISDIINGQSQGSFTVLSFPGHCAALLIETISNPRATWHRDEDLDIPAVQAEEPPKKKKKHNVSHHVQVSRDDEPTTSRHIVYLIQTRPDDVYATTTRLQMDTGEKEKVNGEQQAIHEDVKVYMEVPSFACKVKQHAFNLGMCKELIDLSKSDSPYPKQLQKIRQPTYLIEWIYPNLFGERFDDLPATRVAACLDDWNETAKNQAPWRRSVYYTTLKYVIHTMFRRISDDATYKLLMLWYSVWLMEQHYEHIKINHSLNNPPNAKQFRDIATKFQHALGKISRKVTKFASLHSDNKSLITNVTNRCEFVLNDLLEYQRALAEADKNLYMLPDLSEGLTVEDCRFTLSADFKAVHDKILSGLDPLRARETDRQCVIMPPTSFAHPTDYQKFQHFKQWIDKQVNEALKDHDRLVYLVRLLEDAFLRMCWNSTGGYVDKVTNRFHRFWSNVNDRLSVIRGLHNLVETYQRLCGLAFPSVPRTGEKRYGPVSCSVEQQSRGVLFLWTAALVADQITREIEPVYQEKAGTVLDPKNLDYLCLETDEESNMLASLRSYVKVTMPDAGFKLFDSTAKGAHTFEYVRQLMDSNGEFAVELKDRMVLERRAARERDAEREIQDRRRREQCQAAIEELHAARQEHELAMAVPRTGNAANDKARQSRITQATRTINRIQQDIEELSQPLPPLIHALPQDNVKALIVLFFAFMPELYQYLSSLVYMAQMSLLQPLGSRLQADPTDLPKIDGPAGRAGRRKKENKAQTDVTIKGLTTRYPVRWSQFYNQHAAEAAPKYVVDGMVELASPIDGGLRNLDSRIWYPDELDTVISCHMQDLWLNPFQDWASLQQEISIPMFTRDLNDFSKEKVGQEVQSLLIAPTTQENDRIRENWLVCGVNHYPEWLDKPGLITFGRLRAFPNLQVRELLLTLKSGGLPWTEPGVLALIRQTLQQVGPFEPKAPFGRLWCWDMANPSFRDDFLSTMAKVLDSVRQRPRDHRAILVFVEICAWLAMFDKRADVLLREIVGICREWDEAAAEDANQLLNDPERVEVIRGMRSLYYCYGVLALCGIPNSRLVAEDASFLMSLRVSLANIIQVSNAEHAKEISPLLAKVQYGYSAKESTMKNLMTPEVLSHTLMNSLRLAVSWINPDQVVEWRPVVSEYGTTFAYEGVVENGSIRVYISCSDGVVLLNGFPVTRLQNDILEHSLYKRSFGDARFTVRASEDTYFKTEDTIDGYTYEFAFQRGDLLFVLESPAGREGESLVLIDSKYLSSIPLRLREKHSHWLDVRNGLLYFRPVYFRGERKVIDKHLYVKTYSYVMHIVPEGNQLTGQVYRLLTRDETVDTPAKAMEMIANRHAEVLCPSDDPGLEPLMSVLAKFDLPSNILPFSSIPETEAEFVDTRKAIQKLTFTRANLTFVLEGDRLVSEQFRDYQLSEYQCLDDTLLGFHDYLVLELRSSLDTTLPSKRLLVRDGQITSISRDDEGCAAKVAPLVVKGKDRKNAELRQSFASRYLVFDLNRTGMFNANAIQARLALAALYVATSTPLKDPLVGMTGIEYAIKLLRESWTDKPYEPLAIYRLKNLLEVAHEPAIKNQGGDVTLNLLIAYLMKESVRMSFLYPQHEPYDVPRHRLEDKRAYRRGKFGWSELACLNDEEEGIVFGERVSDPYDVEKVVTGAKMDLPQGHLVARPEKLMSLNYCSEYDEDNQPVVITDSTRKRVQFSSLGLQDGTIKFDIPDANCSSWYFSPKFADFFVVLYIRARELGLAHLDRPQDFVVTQRFVHMHMELSRLTLDGALRRPSETRSLLNIDACVLGSILLTVLENPREMPQAPWPGLTSQGAPGHHVFSNHRSCTFIVETDILHLIREFIPVLIETDDLIGMTAREAKAIRADRQKQAGDAMKSLSTRVFRAMKNSQDLNDAGLPLDERLYYDWERGQQVNLKSLAEIRNIFEPGQRLNDFIRELKAMYHRVSLGAGFREFMIQVSRQCDELIPTGNQEIEAALAPYRVDMNPLPVDCPSDEHVRTVGRFMSPPPEEGDRAIKLNYEFTLPDMDAIYQSIKENVVVPEDDEMEWENHEGLSPPLERGHFDTPLGKEMVDELHASWKAYMREQQGEGVEVVSRDAAHYKALQKRISQARRSLWKQIDEAIHGCTDTAFGLALKFARLTNTRSSKSILDVYRSHLLDNTKELNPKLSNESKQNLKIAVKQVMLLQVYEDQMARLQEHIRKKNTSQVQAELSATRSFDIVEDEPPAMMVFEIEQGLTIRPVQIQVYKHMLSNANTVLQLNMGEGKSKVIIPLLCAHYARKNDAIARVNVLSALLPEMYDYLHHVLNGILGIRIRMMPFNREVDLVPLVDKKRSYEPIRQLDEAFDDAMKNPVVMLVAPEHRLSMQLKWLELAHKQFSTYAEEDEGRANLGEFVLNQPFVDILDESDELLRHTYQLIYTLGSQQVLANGTERWLTAQAVLRSFNKPEISRLLSDPHHAVRGEEKPGCFTPLRLLDNAHMDQVRQLVIDDILTRPPIELQVVAQQNPRAIELMRKFALNVEMDTPEQIRQVSEALKINARVWAVALTLRGILSYGILEHALTKRHRVEYGVNPTGPKRLAVPYRAKDLPSDRTEFGHPDVALTLTMIHYYLDGLNERQVEESFKGLLQGGATEARERYTEWFEASRHAMTEEEQLKINDVSKLDLTNEGQLRMLNKYYGHNMEAINYWLNRFVFPKECVQFPTKLTANAWDLAYRGDHRSRLNGFSGTNDNSRTLPVGTRQKDVASLKSTNGKMLQILTDPNMNNRKYHTVELGWRCLVDLFIKLHQDAIRHKTVRPVAIIDSGALMTGVGNKEVASTVLHLLPDSFLGAIFFDEDTGRLTVLDPRGYTKPLNTSAIRPADCFVYLDDAHTRGTDLKLGSHAHALVTIGKGMQKDKLVQAAMRMRQLGKGQTVSFVGTPEVSRKIADLCEVEPGMIDIGHVLRWATSNTVTEQEKAILEWGRQGMEFTEHIEGAKQVVAQEGRARDFFLKLVIKPEPLGLEHLFGKSLVQKPAIDILEHQFEAASSRVRNLGHGNAELAHQLAEVITECHNSIHNSKAQIMTKARKYCSHMLASVGGLDDEYERELEVQAEELRQRQFAMGAMWKAEQNWEFENILNPDFVANGRAGNAGYPRLNPLRKTLEETERLRHLVAAMNGSSGALSFAPTLLCTANFSKTVDGNQPQDEFLRPVDVLIELEDGEGRRNYICVSGREANYLLPIFWKRSRMDTPLIERLRVKSLKGKPEKIDEIDVDLFRRLVRYGRGERHMIEHGIIFRHYPEFSDSMSLQIAHPDDLVRLANQPPPLVDISNTFSVDRIVVQLQVFMGECSYPDPKDKMWLARFLGFIGDAELLAYASVAESDENQPPVKKLKVKPEPGTRPADPERVVPIRRRGEEQDLVRQIHDDVLEDADIRNVREIRHWLMKCNALTSTGCLRANVSVMQQSDHFHDGLNIDFDMNKVALAKCLHIRSTLKGVQDPHTETICTSLVNLRGQTANFERSDLAKMLSGIL